MSMKPEVAVNAASRPASACGCRKPVSSENAGCAGRSSQGLGGEEIAAGVDQPRPLPALLPECRDPAGGDFHRAVARHIADLGQGHAGQCAQATGCLFQACRRIAQEGIAIEYVGAVATQPRRRQAHCAASAQGLVLDRVRDLHAGPCVADRRLDRTRHVSGRQQHPAHAVLRQVVQDPGQERAPGDLRQRLRHVAHHRAQARTQSADQDDGFLSRHAAGRLPIRSASTAGGR